MPSFVTHRVTWNSLIPVKCLKSVFQTKDTKELKTQGVECQRSFPGMFRMMSKLWAPSTFASKHAFSIKDSGRDFYFPCFLSLMLLNTLRQIFLRTQGRDFAQRGTHTYAHDFATPLGFLFIWCGIEKNNKKKLELLIYFIEWCKIFTTCVC